MEAKQGLWLQKNPEVRKRGRQAAVQDFDWSIIDKSRHLVQGLHGQPTLALQPSQRKSLLSLSHITLVLHKEAEETQRKRLRTGAGGLPVC